eukprot:gi/632986380/ref/XP_007910206.1/ PREDICTED: nck-associated protein 5-like [Callorhinchus milii]
MSEDLLPCVDQRVPTGGVAEPGPPERNCEPPERSREPSQNLLDRLKTLEEENNALVLASESQREAYERCLDEVANHVVQALLNQKDLREECVRLKTRVCDLEHQNQALSNLFHHRLQISSDPDTQVRTPTT